VGGDPQLYLVSPDIHHGDFDFIAEQHLVPDFPR